jgi:hypothetical protein
MKSNKEGNSGIYGEHTFKPGYIKSILVTAILVTASLAGYGQGDQDNDQQQYHNQQPNGNAGRQAEQSITPMVAQYDEEVRSHILVATQYPEVLQKLAQIRDNTSRSFQETIQGYSQKKQNWFYEISRYPGLMHDLATLPRKQSQEQINGLVANIPNASEDLKEAAWKLYKNHYSELVAVDNLNQEAISAFEEMVRPLNSDAQNAFRALQDMPDVLSILNDHSDLTARLGEKFRDDPDGTRQELAELHNKQEAESKQDLANYQRDLSQDPQAQQEYNQAQQEYASAQKGYSYPAPTGDKVVNIYTNPYPYWFGYPYWYGSPVWYPRAYGFGGGLYYGMGLYGYPSFGFSTWFFNGGYRRYPHLYRTYGNYYRNNYLSRGRYLSPRSYGFSGAAERHYSTGRGYTRPNYLSSPGRMYNQASGRIYNLNRGNSQGRTYSQGFRSVPSYGSRSYGGGSRSFSPSYGGGFSRGGGYSRGYSGGGVRGGGRR